MPALINCGQLNRSPVHLLRHTSLRSWLKNKAFKSDSHRQLFARTAVEDTNHAPDCGICGGSQVVDLDASSFIEWGVIQGIKFDKKFEVQGILDLKDATVTVKAKTRLYYWWPTFEVLHFSSVYNQVVKRMGGDQDTLRYPPARNYAGYPIPSDFKRWHDLRFWN